MRATAAMTKGMTQKLVRIKTLNVRKNSMTEHNSIENCVQLCRKISKLSQDNVWDNFETTDA